MTRFEAGKTYYATSIGDHNVIYELHVIRRTKCFVFTQDRKYKVSTAFDGDREWVSQGAWSMAGGWFSTDTERPLTDWERASKRENAISEGATK